MGNLSCSVEEAARLASIARDICPFPSYDPSPHFFNMLSINSSRHLGEHYAAVQASLSPAQLEGFKQGLRTTFGREGKVTHGSVGVVALSLAVLFDTLARQLKGQWEPETGPIPGLFLKDARGKYPHFVNIASEYLRLVPSIANNPPRMREETERFFRQLLIDLRKFDKAWRNNRDYGQDVLAVNSVLGYFVKRSVRLHLTRLTNSTTVEQIEKSARTPKSELSFPKEISDTEAGVGSTSTAKTRNRRDVETRLDFSLNCLNREAGKQFLAEVQKSDNQTQTAFRSCQPFDGRIPKTWIHYVTKLAWLDVVFNPVLSYEYKNRDALIAQREDFDLKANALGKWYFRQLLLNVQNFGTAEINDRDYGQDVLGVNYMLGQFLERSVRLHLTRLTNSTTMEEILKSARTPKTELSFPKKINDTEAGVGSTSTAKTRKRRIPAPDTTVDFSLNCDAQEASEQFLAEVQKSDNQTQTAFRSCQTFNRRIPKTWIHYVASLVWLDVINHPVLGDEQQNRDALIAQRDNFDLKANALGKW